MHLEFFVEEPSSEAALLNLVPKIVGPQTSFLIHNYGSKSSLLKKLPDRLQAYRRWLPEHHRIIILVDEDRENCQELKQYLEQAAIDSGLVTKSNTSGSNFQVLNRLAIEELEAWFFGDVPALIQAFPGVPPTLDQKAPYRNPDSIRGGTWEALERVLQKAGYYKSGLAKIDAALKISERMDPSRNQSKSFQVFRDGLLKMVKSQAG